MRGVLLNKEQLKVFNSENSFGLFSSEINEKIEQLNLKNPDAPIFFNFEKYIEVLTEKLFQEYDEVLVTEDNKIFAVRGYKQKLLQEAEESFISAMKLQFQYCWPDPNDYQ